jgi:hypothetical protein
MAIFVVGLAVFAAIWGRNTWPIYRPGDRDSYAFGHARLSLSRSLDSQPKGWFKWASDEGNDGHGHVPASPREPEPHDGGDDDTEL